MMHSEMDSIAFRNDQVVILPTAMAVLWSRASSLREFWDVVQAFGSWVGAIIIQERRGLRLTLDGMELGQLNWAGQLILALDPAARHAVVIEKLARVDLDLADENKVVFDLRGREDIDRALSLLGLAYLLADWSKMDTASPACHRQSVKAVCCVA